MPALTPELVNSVICCGSSAPRTFVSRSYQPQPGSSSQSLAKPAMLVDSARSALQAMTSGRPYSARAMALTQAPHVASRRGSGAFSPGCVQIAAG